MPSGSSPDRLSSRDEPPGDARPPALSGGARAAARVVAVATSLVALAVYVVIALVRMRHPFELEWLEGAAVVHVDRVLHGRALYVAPSLEFTPFIYTPLYWFVSAAVAAVTGVGFLPLRIVSFVASLGCFAAVFALVRRTTDDRVAGVVAVGLFAACFRIGGAWFDVARVDMLALALVLAAAVVVQRYASARWMAAAGALVALAFLTKQTALVAGLPLVITAARRGVRPGAAYLAGVLGPVAVTTLLFDRASDGWYRYYVFDLPRSHPSLDGGMQLFWQTDMAHVGVAAALGVAFLAIAVLRRNDALWLHAPLLGGLLIASLSARLHTGGYDNVLLPVYAGIAVAAGCGWHAIGALRAVAWPTLVATGLVVVQLIGLRYDVAEQLPTAADRAAGRHAREVIGELPGRVLVIGHPWLAAEAGKGGRAHEAAVHDVLRGPDTAVRRTLVARLTTALRARRYDWLVLDLDPSPALPPDLLDGYEAIAPVFAGPEHDGVGLPVTGLPYRPSVIYRARR